jgi:hypothetical protein
MEWQTLIVVAVLCGLLGMGIWAYAYRLGFKHGRSTIVPYRLINELLDHKIYCIGQDPAEARLEVGTDLGIEEWESRPMVQQILRAREREPNTELPSA